MELHKGFSALVECSLKVYGDQRPLDDRLSDTVNAYRAYYGISTTSDWYRFVGKPEKGAWEKVVTAFKSHRNAERYSVISTPTYIVVFEDNFPIIHIAYNFGPHHTSISFNGDHDQVVETKTILKELFDKKIISVRSVYIDRKNGILEHGEDFLNIENKVIAPQLHYPYLNKSVTKLAADFIEAKSNAILMIGPPGTGKSTFQRAITYELVESGRPIYIMNDDLILQHSGLNDFIKQAPNGSVFLIEDADLLVSKRTEGNCQMAALLNQIDGIIPTDKKFIISTNLPTTDKVDDALTRPGRCYAVLNFRKLLHAEANVIYKTYNPDHDDIPDTGDLSLAEVLNYNSDVEVSRRKNNFGFNCS